jgi:hypothetical protein
MDTSDNLLKIENLLATRDLLGKELEASQQEFSRLVQDIARKEERLLLINKLIEVDSAANVTTSRETSLVKQAIPRTTESSRKIDGAMLETVESILEEAEAPMHIGEIREALIRRNIPIPGRGDDANIIIRLRSERGRFTRTARGTYALSKWGLPSIDNNKTSIPTGGK